MRSVLLAASQNRWLQEHAPQFWFVRRTASRFMPGDTDEDALAAAQQLQGQGIGAIISHLGENIIDSAQASAATEQYVNVLGRIHELGLDADISVKLTQLGLDLSSSQCYSNLKTIMQHAGEKSIVWVDMESSRYVDITLELYRRARTAFPNVGVCLQAYLHRTARDIAAIMPLQPAIRLVKGAYKEPPDVAFPSKKDVDENFFSLARRLLGEPVRRAGVRTAIATHDGALIRRITDLAALSGAAKDEFEFQMLYGIQRGELNRLVCERYRTKVLVAYGAHWFPWFMRRLAERPANMWLVARNVFTA